MRDINISILTDSYEKKLSSMGFKPIQGPDDKSNNSSRVDIEHCLWMIIKIRHFLDEGNVDRAYRWLGFIQGCLWCCGVFTINDMKAYNDKYMEIAA